MLLWRALNTVKSVPYRLVRQLGESSIRSLICCSLLPEHDMSHHTITSSAFRSQPLHETKEMAADFFFSTAIAFRFYNPKMERLSGSLTYKTPATMAGCQYHLSTITRVTQHYILILSNGNRLLLTARRRELLLSLFGTSTKAKRLPSLRPMWCS